MATANMKLIKCIHGRTVARIVQIYQSMLLGYPIAQQCHFPHPLQLPNHSAFTIHVLNAYKTNEHEIRKPDKLNCSQSSTADDQNNWTAWIAASLLCYALPMRNNCLEI